MILVQMQKCGIDNSYAGIIGCKGQVHRLVITYTDGSFRPDGEFTVCDEHKKGFETLGKGPRSFKVKIDEIIGEITPPPKSIEGRPDISKK